MTSRLVTIGLLALFLLLPLARSSWAQCTVTNTGSNLVDESLAIGNGGLGAYGLDGPSCDESYLNVIVGTGADGDGFLDVENGASLTGTDLFVGRSNDEGGGAAEFRNGAQVERRDPRDQRRKHRLHPGQPGSRAQHSRLRQPGRRRRYGELLAQHLPADGEGKRRERGDSRPMVV